MPEYFTTEDFRQKMIQKFRAWGRDGNYPGTPSKIFEMFYDVSIVTTYDDKKQHVIADFGMYNESDYSGTKIIDYILMRFTGLFDNSTPKKEIFESDIVEWEHKDTGQIVRGIVKYDTELGFWGMTDVRFDDLRAIGYLANQRVTVLGNIYQNKELVEELK